jgi:predicted RNA-binding Zn-ribbon protein involved in translation (DUF1610 family)
MDKRYVFLITILEFVFLVSILINVLLFKEPIKVSCDCDIQCPEVKCPNCGRYNTIWNETAKRYWCKDCGQEWTKGEWRHRV